MPPIANLTVGALFLVTATAVGQTRPQVPEGDRPAHLAPLTVETAPTPASPPAVAPSARQWERIQVYLETGGRQSWEEQRRHQSLHERIEAQRLARIFERPSITRGGALWRRGNGLGSLEVGLWGASDVFRDGGGVAVTMVRFSR